MARLLVKTDDGTHTVELKPGDAVGLGRDPENQVPLPDARGASRKHCRIAGVPSGGRLAWELTDLGATNKTRVNGRPVDKQVLSSGDVITIGTAEITFEDPQEEERLRQAGARGVCYLEWASGDRKGEKVWLDTPRTTIGRRPSNTIPIEDRMSSGHHAEITKDLNGYTVRDLGSTNGTLVNGEPMTEAALSHGSRVRIGNSKFVFKDPSMKDIEVELAQFEDDDGWGMMGDIDLSKARGSYGGLLVGLLLVGLAAAGGWLLMSEAEQGGGQVGGGGTANLVVGGDMEDEELVDFLWVAAGEEAPVSITSSTQGKGRALSIRHTGGTEAPQPVLVSYADEFPALAQEPLRVRASLRARGDASFVAVWRNWRDPGEDGAAATSSGGERLTHTISLGSGQVDVVATKPHWAESVVFGVRLGPDASATLDDVSVTREKSGAAPTVEVDCPGDPKAFLNPSGGLDIANGMTVLLVGGRPIVRLADGTVLTQFMAEGAPEKTDGGATVQGSFPHGEDKVSARITWTRMETDEGLRASVQCAQAAAVGLSALMPRAHVGAQMNVLTDAGAGSIQAAPGERLDGIRKTLSGNPNPEPGRPRTLVTFAPNSEAGANTLEIAEAVDASVLDVRIFSTGSSASIDVITNFEIQAKAAQDALDSAERLVRTKPGQGIEALREITLLYPFIERVRDRARTLADEADKGAQEEVARYRAALSDFRIFRSEETLKRLTELAQTMLERYPAREGAGGELERAVEEITAQGKEARAVWYADNAGNDLTRLERLADLLAQDRSYEPMAAIFYRTIIERFGHMEGEDAFGRRITRARERYEELRRENAEAIPDLPNK